MMGSDMGDSDLDLLQGTLDVLILKALSQGPSHGYAVVSWIRSRSDGAFQVEDRALYVALHRLAAQGLLAAEWGVSENNRRAKFYALTAKGRRALQAKESHWERYADAMSKVLRAT
jgi:transcriptional regulator